MSDLNFKTQLVEQIRLLETVRADEILLSKINIAISWLIEALQENKPVLICGNGGSATDALHISGELVGMFSHERRGLNVICLNTNVAIMTAWSNDCAYETVFARQVEAHGHEGGVVWGISTSGNSPNVTKALEKARDKGMKTIALTGQGGGRLKDCSDLLIAVPATNTARVQEVHVPIYHHICAAVESHFVSRP